MSTVDHFQRDFIRAIYNEADGAADASAANALAALTCQPGFKVYRNTILKASVDALAANYPSINQLVGSAWFAAAALVYVRATPPQSVCLIEYGQDFPTFLAAFAPAADLPYLGDVAALDRDWTECHIAADEAALDASMLAALAPEALLKSVLQLRAAVRWRWCEAHPAYAIWQAQRSGRDADQALKWRGDGALLSRIDGEVTWQAASTGTCAFLEVCGAAGDLQSAVAAALQREPELDIALLLSTLIQAQAFKTSIITSFV